MSKTYKDKPYKFRQEVKYDDQYESVPYEALEYTLEPAGGYRYKQVFTGNVITRHFSVKKAGIFRKKKRSEVDPSDWWYRHTPGWWTRSRMTVPKRAACRNWEKTLNLSNIEEADCPDYGRKPHQYYW